MYDISNINGIFNTRREITVTNTNIFSMGVMIDEIN